MSKPTISKLIKILEEDTNMADLFQYNQYTKDIELRHQPQWSEPDKILTDGHVLQMLYYMDNIHGCSLTDKYIEQAAYLMASRKAYHPIKDYLLGLKWDGKKRAETWLIEICGADDNIYTRNAGKYVLTAAVNRIFEPGCQFDHMLILEGEQGGGKSTMLQALGGEWYLDTQLTVGENKKDLIDVMRTGWIIEIADLAGFRKNEVDYLRAFITRKTDRVRLAYGRRSENYKRQCVFIGTHNPSGDNQYFKDDTGNRRFWPIKCGNKIDVEGMKKWRDQLWAEAVQMYLRKEQYHFTDPESLAILKELHTLREVDIPINRKIEQYIENRNYVSMEEIFQKIFKIANIGTIPLNEQKVKSTMVGIFFRKIKWIKGSNKKRDYYFRPGFESEEPVIEENVWGD